MMKIFASLLFMLVTLPTLLHATDWLSPEVEDLLAKAKAGEVMAQFKLANAYDSGRGAPRSDKEALRWYMAAAEQGLAEAQNSVGSGLQANKDYSEALKWFKRASDQNHALATNNLAYLYDLGLGVKQDRQHAFSLYSRAADLGWGEAMWNIAIMYGAGQLGAPPDLFNACVWTMRAKRNAEDNGRKLLAQVERVTPMLEHKLSQEQMSSCQQQAELWIPPAAASRSDLKKAPL